MTSFSWIWRFQHLKILGKLYSSHVLCPNVAIFLKNVFIFQDRTLKKNNFERTRISMWFGRENDENVVRTRDWCGWPSSPRSSDLSAVFGIGSLIDFIAYKGDSVDPHWNIYCRLNFWSFEIYDRLILFVLTIIDNDVFLQEAYSGHSGGLWGLSELSKNGGFDFSGGFSPQLGATN